MPETLHPPDYYSGKAHELPLLGKVIVGEETLAGHLDSIVDKKNVDGEDLRECLETLCALGCADIAAPDAFPYRTSLTAQMKTLGLYMVRTQGSAALAYGVASLFFPVIPAVGAVVGFLGICGGMVWGMFSLDKDDEKALGQLRQQRREILEPAYHLAASLDADICRAFLYDDFGQTRSRFELTYRSFSGEERQEVEQELHRMLAAGALDMGEAELDSYLAALAEEGEGA